MQGGLHCGPHPHQPAQLPAGAAGTAATWQVLLHPAQPVHPSHQCDQRRPQVRERCTHAVHCLSTRRSTAKHAKHRQRPPSWQQTEAWLLICCWPAPLPAAAGRSLAEGHSSKRVHYVDCHIPLLLTATSQLNATLLPDTATPSVAGYERLFTGCWNNAIDGVLAGDSCKLASWTGLCTTSEGKKGHCSSGVCRVGCCSACGCAGGCAGLFCCCAAGHAGGGGDPEM